MVFRVAGRPPGEWYCKAAGQAVAQRGSLVGLPPNAEEKVSSSSYLVWIGTWYVGVGYSLTEKEILPSPSVHTNLCVCVCVAVGCISLLGKGMY